MKYSDLNIYLCPSTKSPLTLKVNEELDGEIISGILKSADGKEYLIKDGVPDFTYPPKLPEKDKDARAFYDARGDTYDDNLHLTFDTHNENESEVRNKFVDALELNPSARVLEVAC